MALRQIVTLGDDILYKKSRPVEVFDEKLHALLDDMYDTMKSADGVGLAAVQVGILKRVITIDVGEGRIELINPQIIFAKGSEIDNEGCLSVPGKYGDVERPKVVKVKAVDRNGKEFTMMGSGLLARAFCHEIDHLDGHLFLERASNLHDAGERKKR